MTITKIQPQWQGWAGAPGVSTFYANGAVTDMSPIKTFFEAIKGNLPNGVVIKYPATGDLYDEVSGVLTGATAFSALTDTTSSATAQQYSSATGTHVRWVTAGIVAGRKVRGRTFLVPLTSVAFGVNGQISTVSQAQIASAAAALIAGFPALRVWSRPRPAKAGPPPVAAVDGTIHAVLQGVVPNFATVLRSRRE